MCLHTMDTSTATVGKGDFAGDTVKMKFPPTDDNFAERVVELRKLEKYLENERRVTGNLNNGSLTETPLYKAMDYVHHHPESIIGKGLDRRVYHPLNNPSVVYKVEDVNPKGLRFQNVKEHLITNELAYTVDIVLFARILHISQDGRLAIQEYARDATKEEFEEFLNGKCPSFVTDIKIENVGVINGRVVIRDYGSSIITKNYRNTSVKKRI